MVRAGHIHLRGSGHQGSYCVVCSLCIGCWMLESLLVLVESSWREKSMNSIYRKCYVHTIDEEHLPFTPRQERTEFMRRRDASNNDSNDNAHEEATMRRWWWWWCGQGRWRGDEGDMAVPTLDGLLTK